MRTALIVYASLSGNTQEVAELIAAELARGGIKVIEHRIGGADLPPAPADFDAMLIGSYTWGKGATPNEVKDFVADLGYKPKPVYVFGTGDTQFGGDKLFCAAADKLAKFYESPAEPLKIEQSPRGAQEAQVYEWARGILYQERVAS